MGLTIHRRISTKARVITTLVALFALVAQPMYGLVAGQVASAATSDAITTEGQLRSAAADKSTTVLNIGGSFNVTSKVNLIGPDVHVKGNGHTLTFKDNLDGQTDYIFQAYRNNTTVENIKLTGADAAVLANGAELTLEGSVDVGGNELGGIEVSNGDAKLVIADGATLLNGTEVALQPTVWIDQWDKSNATVKHSQFTEAKYRTDDGKMQKQYYLSASHARTLMPTANITSHSDGDAVNGVVGLVGKATAGVNEIKNTYFAVQGGLQDTQSEGESPHALEWDATYLDEGLYRVLFKTGDQAGNKDEVSINLEVDKTAPVVEFESPTASSTVKGGTDIKASIKDNNLSHYYMVVKTRTDSSPKWSTLKEETISTEEFLNGTIYTVPETVDGEVVVLLEARDKAGNKDETDSVKKINFYVDSTAPTAVITSHNDGDTVRGVVNIVGEAVTNSGDVKSTHFEVSDSKTKDSTKKEGEAVHSFTWDTNGMADGVYTVRFKTSDALGNKDQVSIRLTVDNTPPTIKAGDHDRQLKTLTFTTDEDVNSVRVTGEVEGDAVQDADDPTVWVLDVSAYNTPGVTYTYTATATDVAGNESITTTQGLDGDVFATFTIASLFNGIGVTGETIPELPTGTDADRSTNARSFFSGFNTVGAAAFVADPAEVLGAQDDKGIDTGILGASKDVAAIAPSAQGWKFFGVTWYWLLLAIAAVSAIWWWIAAARRRSQEA